MARARGLSVVLLPELPSYHLANLLTRTPRLSYHSGDLALCLTECQLSTSGGTTKFRPLHDRVVVRRVDAEEKTKGGIIIPDTAKEKPQEGEVIAAGPGARDESGKVVPLDVKAGDRILFGKWSGTEVRIDGEDLLIMKESDIMGVVTLTAATRKAA
jgi:chaperonin GroES